LGELYEADYVKAATGFSAPDKQDNIRHQASALFKALCAKLDALSSFTYTPKPVVTELEVRHWSSEFEDPVVDLVSYAVTCTSSGLVSIAGTANHI
jgi:U3 small nucleolar ribonucleoprotein component